MNSNKIKFKSISLRQTTLQILSAIALPLFIIIILFDWYTSKSQQQAILNTYKNTLSLYASMVDSSFQTAEEFVTTTAVNDIDFQSVIYAKSKTDAYLASKAVAEKYLTLIKADDILCGLLTYSSPFDCWYITCAASYPQKDFALIRNAIINATDPDYYSSGWQPLQLSDRTIFLYSITNHATSITAIVDPTRQNHSNLEPNNQIFFILSDGKPLTSASAFGNIISVSENGNQTFQMESGEKYTLISLPLNVVDCYIVYASPYKTFYEYFTIKQKISFIATICLLATIPFCWFLLQGLLLKPLNVLTSITKEIQVGNIQTRALVCSHISEVNTIAQTVNTMLDTIQQQKIDAYEKQLETQKAQIQYLQLQIKPHFYLNCLNLIFSLAEEKKYATIQKVVLDLSVYLRNIFKENSTLIPLETEIRSVKSYVNIQGCGIECPPKLELSVMPETLNILIPPLIILTFVENTFKHGNTNIHPLTVRIKCSLLKSNEDDYLNIVIIDNGGGFPDDQLTILNINEDQVYRDQHIGISNIRQRLKFLYRDKAALILRNISDCACVELFLPISKDEKEGVLL